MEKAKLRQEMLQVLRQKAKSLEKTQQEICLQKKLINHPLFKQAQVIGAYLPSEIECGLDLVFKKIWQQQKKLVAPQAHHKKMHFYPLAETTKRIPSTFGILEPEATEEVLKKEIDLLIVPGLIFNATHYRIGFGGGYYDRFLQDFKGETISLVFPEQLRDFQPEIFDIPVNQLITL